MNEEEKKEKLFEDGIKFFKSKEYFEAHESWEDLWSDYYLEDKKFIQGLIQLSVSFVHLGNGNLIGAKSLLNKANDKFQLYNGIQRGINIKKLLGQIKIIAQAYDDLNNPTDFDWELVPNLE